MNKQELIETLSNNRRALGFDAERYNMHMPIGPYTLSVSVGDGMYSMRQGDTQQVWPVLRSTVRVLWLG